MSRHLFKIRSNEKIPYLFNTTTKVQCFVKHLVSGRIVVRCFNNVKLLEKLPFTVLPNIQTLKELTFIVLLNIYKRLRRFFQQTNILQNNRCYFPMINKFFER